MKTFADLIHPVTPEAFAGLRGEPLHIPAEPGAPKRSIMEWATLNRLLTQVSNWTPANLKLVHNGEPVAADRYCIVARTEAGPVLRPSPAKVEVLLASGASLILDEVRDLTPDIQALSETLGQEFAALIGANLYCSFGGVQGFGTHYDLHDVFAIHCEGEKVWRLYRNRAPDPVAPPSEADPRAYYTATRGPLVREVVMRPGDVLYLPRGWYHDALATEGVSLHLTISVTPLYGRILFSLLEQAAMQDPAFRAWLPPAQAEDGKALSAHLARLADRLAAIIKSPFFGDEIAMTQARLLPRPPRYALPERPSLTFYRPTGLMGPITRGPASAAMDWAYSQASFAIEDLSAQFDFVPEAALRQAVAEAERAGALQRL
ncbi:JmjC domain-containing protein [Brevundimonas staleyi]|uniref:JmjC domain-containing protein n=1 Tax=Brevundimonas staleyi TaxID=74326 RepID=A0ABW0FMX7_9CAUL